MNKAFAGGGVHSRQVELRCSSTREVSWDQIKDFEFQAKKFNTVLVIKEPRRVPKDEIGYDPVCTLQGSLWRQVCWQRCGVDTWNQ